MSSQKKMEEAFLKQLRHLLSRKYKYTIVADRGFGHSRFINDCLRLGFNYILRVKNLSKEFMAKAACFTASIDLKLAKKPKGILINFYRVDCVRVVRELL